MRRWLTVGILVGVVVVGGSAIWWMFLSSFGERQWRDLRQRLQAEGYGFEYQTLERSGFPVELVWELRGVSLSHPGADGGPPSFRGEAERVRVAARPWSPQRMAFRVEGRHGWAVETGGPAGMVDVTVGAAAGTFGPAAAGGSAAGGSGWQLETVLRDVAARPRSVSTDRSSTVDALRVGSVGMVVMAPLPADRIAIDLHLDRIRLPQDFGLGRTVENFSIQGEMIPLLRGRSEAAVRGWQAAGGRLSLSDARLRFGSVDGQASGELGLDRELRLSGDLAVRLRRPTVLLGLAAERGWVTERQRPMFAMGIGLFTTANAAGEPEARLQVGFRDGGVWLGPIRLGDLPPVLAAPH